MREEYRARRPCPNRKPDHPDQYTSSWPSRDFTIELGRFYLYHVWLQQRFSEETIVKGKGYTPQERAVFLYVLSLPMKREKVIEPLKPW